MASQIGHNKTLLPAGRQFRLLEFTLLLTGSMTVLAGAGIAAAIPAIEAHFRDQENAEILSKLVLTIPSLFIAVLAPVAGRIIDRFGRKIPLMISLALYLVAGTSGYFISDLTTLLISRALLGVAVAGIMTINTTLIGDYFQGKMRNRFMGWQGGVMAFGGVVFISAGGFLADFSWRMPFLVYTFAAIGLILTAVYIYEPEIKPDRIPSSAKSLSIKSVRKYALVYMTAFFGMTFLYMIPTHLPFLLDRTANINSSSIGYSIGLAILAGAFLSVNYGKIKSKLSFCQVYAVSFSLMGSGFIIIASMDNYFSVLGGLVIAGFGTGLLMPNTNLWLISLAPADYRGRLVGMLNLFVYAGQFLSPVLIYPLIRQKSIDFAFAVCGIIMLLFTLFFLIQNKYPVQAEKYRHKKNDSRDK